MRGNVDIMGGKQGMKCIGACRCHLPHSGFTLVEVLIALAIGLIVCVPAMSLFSVALRESAVLYRQVEIAEAASGLCGDVVAQIRLGETVAPVTVREGSVRLVCRVLEGEDVEGVQGGGGTNVDRPREVVVEAQSMMGTVSGVFRCRSFPVIRNEEDTARDNNPLAESEGGMK